MSGKKKEGKKHRKHGRFAFKCTAYFNSGRRMKNKKRKVLKHLKKHPNDSSCFHVVGKMVADRADAC